jgi:hypothetical protein
MRLRGADFPAPVGYNRLEPPGGTAVFDISGEQVSRLATNCLIVAGGFVAGYVVGALAAVGFDKLVIHRKSPHELHKTVRILCGLLVAILVALLVFGGGLGGGGGGGNGPGQTPTTGSPTSTGPSAKPTDPTEPPTKVAVEAVRVRVLAGTEVERGSDKFYRLGDAGEAADRAAVLAAVADRKKTAKGAVVLVYEFGREAGPNTIAFTELDRDAKQAGVQLMSDDDYRKFVKAGK